MGRYARKSWWARLPTARRSVELIVEHMVTTTATKLTATKLIAELLVGRRTSATTILSVEYITILEHVKATRPMELPHVEARLYI